MRVAKGLTMLSQWRCVINAISSCANDTVSDRALWLPTLDLDLAPSCATVTVQVMHESRPRHRSPLHRLGLRLHLPCTHSTKVHTGLWGESWPATASKKTRSCGGRCSKGGHTLDVTGHAASSPASSVPALLCKECAALARIELRPTFPSARLGAPTHCAARVKPRRASARRGQTGCPRA